MGIGGGVFVLSTMSIEIEEGGLRAGDPRDDAHGHCT
jgi:hypothetical protein